MQTRLLTSEYRLRLGPICRKSNADDRRLDRPVRLAQFPRVAGSVLQTETLSIAAPDRVARTVSNRLLHQGESLACVATLRENEEAKEHSIDPYSLVLSPPRRKPVRLVLTLEFASGDGWRFCGSTRVFAPRLGGRLGAPPPRRPMELYTD